MPIRGEGPNERRGGHHPLQLVKVAQINYVSSTEDGSTDAVPQILYGQYLILGVVCFRPKKQHFLQEKDPATLSHEQGTHGAKKVPIVWLEIAKMPPKISAQFVCPSPKVSNF